MDIGRRKVAVGGIWRKTPGLARANHLFPVQPVVVIGIHDGDTVCRQTGVNLTFGFRHAFQRTKTFKMCCSQIVD
ncbi:hypothetical protein D3C72_782010 [compost metagenome]